MAALLDILDSELRLWQDGRAVRSPGFALLDGDSYRYGEDARSHARRQPRNINTRYWWQLGTRPLQPALGPARHTADLVHGHLLALHEAAGRPGELVLAVPESLHKEQLSLLLGIIRACPFDAVGLANRSLLVAAAHEARGSACHLELQLHQALLTRLDSDGGELTVTAEQVLPGCGFLALQESLVEAIARSFIDNTRFDPRRQAETEQQLYDNLGTTLAALRDADDTILEAGGYRSRISYDALRAAGRRLHDSVGRELGRNGDAPLLLVDPLVDLLPGFTQSFPGARVASSRDLPEALAAHGERIVQPGEALHLVRSLPVGNGATGPRSAPASAAASPRAPAEGRRETGTPAPTHLLEGGQAAPLVDNMPLADGWSLVHGDGGWRLAPGRGTAVVNDGPWKGAALAAGDRIAVGGGQWQLIEVRA
ncbi:hypothetical protein [Pseudohaliea rubra]|uniref:Uncharacterized protein n=1 Tax=Pseudohaliea rubra DSM 19751 TaxID=1265313 RepID=A0A095VTQ8_9GAMM|nr:hypothetical protein [Pseudohaliea rubra]KGE04463.1 hypothetical protein HRUBRA_00928 [Pseudohaliea rubra DSM 19751]